MINLILKKYSYGFFIVFFEKQQTNPMGIVFAVFD